METKELENTLLRNRIIELESAIENHFKNTIGQDACWLNDEELWKTLNDGINRTYPHSETPSMEEMMLECVKYCASRQRNETKETQLITLHKLKETTP